jgi:chromosome segregation ATPase
MNDIIKSTLIKVETLQKEYEVTLQQYQEAGQNYITDLQTNKITALKGRTWWGAAGLKEGSVQTQEECENMCASSKECSGATFNPVKRYCWTRTGKSKVTVGREDDYALISRQKATMSIMKYLNKRLLNLNEEIQYELNKIQPEIKEQYEAKHKKQKQLQNSYDKLLEHKIKIDEELEEYNSIEQDENNQILFVNQQSLSYKLWVVLACLILFVTIKQMYGDDIKSKPFFILIFIIILIILSYTLSSPSGIFMWFILLIFVIIMKKQT